MNKMPELILVDDDQKYLSLLGDFLRFQGIAVNSTDSAYDAIKKIEARRFDLLITDFQMKEMNGVDLARRVRTIQPDMPIILNTACVIPDHYGLVSECTISRVLEKSARLTDMLEIINQCCHSDIRS